MIRQYKHFELKDEKPSSVDVIRYNNKDVLLYYSGSKDNHDLMIVLGYVVGKYMGKQYGDIPVTNVEPIVDKLQRKELSDLLTSRGEKGPVNFW